MLTFDNDPGPNEPVDTYPYTMRGILIGLVIVAVVVGISLLAGC
jgi:hypothetical protein